MKFGSSAAEAEKEPPRSSGGSQYMKYLKDGDTVLRILEEPDAWKYYWEHYNPNGYPFPCTNDTETCPGCTSGVKKMESVSRRVAFNAYDGEYVNVWKMPKTVADKLKNRFARIGTVTDRDYIITRIKTGTGDNARWDFDLEGETPSETNADLTHITDPEILLANAFEEAWGDSQVVSTAQTSARGQAVQRQLSSVPQSEDPPSEPEAERDAPAKGEGFDISEEELRDMTVAKLRKFCKENDLDPPSYLKRSDSIVDWMMDQQ